MKAVILCGGKGTRAYPHTIDVPKPLLDVGGRPILEHVMQIYAEQGFREFILAAGYRHDLIADFARTLPSAWAVDVVDTGEETNTGGRVYACADRVGERFFVTYGDGVGDVDLAALLAFHDEHSGIATLTAVPLPSPYGTIDASAEGRVDRFLEKPTLLDHWINAGFFVFDRAAFDHWGGEDLEREVLPAIAVEGELFVYRHQGFWKSMDTHKDALELTALCSDGDGGAPWHRSATPLSS